MQVQLLHLPTQLIPTHLIQLVEPNKAICVPAKPVQPDVYPLTTWLLVLFAKEWLLEYLMDVSK